MSRAFRLGEIIEGETTIAALKERVRTLCIPVRCRGEVIGVLTRESAPSFGRQPGELERTYVDIFNRFARMIVAGDFPFDAQDAETEEAPRVGDGVLLLDASAARGVRLAQRRVGAPPHRLARQRGGPAARGPRPRRRAGPDGVLDRGPGHRGVRAGPRGHRAHPLHPADRPRIGHRRGRAHPRHLRAAPPGPAAALQGRHHPRDPPPGEEQPADDLLAAAAAGPAVHLAARPSWRSRSRCGGSARSPSCTRSSPARRATTWPSSRSCGRSCAWWRRACRRRTARSPSTSRARPGCCRPRWPRRWRSCSTSCSRTPSTTPSRPRSTSRRRPARSRSASTTTASACGPRWSTTAWASRRTSSSPRRPAWACRSCGPSSPASWWGRSPWPAATARGTGPGPWCASRSRSPSGE